MDPQRAYRLQECSEWQKNIEQELAEIPEEAEPTLKRQLTVISELTYEYEFDLPPEERLVVLHVPTLSRLVKIAWFGKVLVDAHNDKFAPLAGITYAGSLNETWGHFIIQQEIMRGNMKWLETGAYLLPAGAFIAVIFPQWKTKTLRQILIPQCPLLPIMSYNEYIERLQQEILQISRR